MHGGPGEFDGANGASEVNVGKSQPKSGPGQGMSGDEFPLKHANVRPHRQRMLHQVLMAHALRMGGGSRRIGPDGTTMGTAIGGGAAGGGAGGGT